MSAAGRRIVFAAAARNVAPFLPGVLANIANWATGFADWALVIGENDSTDDTKAILRGVAARDPAKVRLLEMDGLDGTHPLRTDRIAAVRNRVMEAIVADPVLRDFDFLAVLDMDLPNAPSTPAMNFNAAVDFLAHHGDTAGVTANSLPVMYDIWALRHPEWCPGDFMDEIRAATPAISDEAAWAKFVHARQRFIDPQSAPIEVESAFGGLGLYRLADVLMHRYRGLKPDGTEICEHVPFHAAIRATGKRLFILPRLQNVTSFSHTSLRERFAPARLFGPLGNITVMLPRGAEATDGDRQFGLLAALQAKAGGGTILDLEVGCGQSLAMARLAGCGARYTGLAPDEMSLAMANHNVLVNSAIMGMPALVQAPATALADFLDNDVALLRLCGPDDLGLLRDNGAAFANRHPVLWARGAATDPQWQSLAREMGLAIVPGGAGEMALFPIGMVSLREQFRAALQA